MGTPELAATCLRALQSCAGFEVVAVVTQPDRPKGRDLRVTASPVKVLALQSQVPVLQPARARDDSFIQELKAFRPDVIVVAAYGQILPQTILDTPPFGCVNVHTSLLPKYRGAAPIQRVLLNGDSETGITLIKMDAQMDTGPIIAQEVLPILSDDNAATLHDRLAQLGGASLLRFLPDYLKGSLPLHSQNSELATYAPKIKKEEGLIDWRRSASEISNQFRGLYPWPGLFTYFTLGKSELSQSSRKMLKVWRIAPSEGDGPPGTILRIDAQVPIVACGRRSFNWKAANALRQRNFSRAIISRPVNCLVNGPGC